MLSKIQNASGLSHLSAPGIKLRAVSPPEPAAQPPAEQYSAAVGGVFLDVNDNLVFVPQLAYGEAVGISNFQQASIGRDSTSWFSSSPATVSREPGTSHLPTTHLGVDSFDTSDNSVTQNSGNKVRREVVRTESGVQVREWNHTRFEIKPQGNQLEIYQNGDKTHTLKRQGGTIHLQKYNSRPYVVTQEGPKITVDKGFGRPIEISKTSEGFEVNDYRQYKMNYSAGQVQSDQKSFDPVSYR